jgi:hypothetical protein
MERTRLASALRGATTGLIRAMILVIFTLTGVAARQESTKSLIEQYKTATCLPITTSPYVPEDKKTRFWDTTVVLRDGSTVTVKAATMTGGVVNLIYLVSGQQYVAANAGDYVYPTDIRIDTQHDRLYVVASGLAGGIWHRTVLFEYDLRERRQTARRGVKDRDLPNECPGPADTNRGGSSVQPQGNLQRRNHVGSAEPNGRQHHSERKVLNWRDRARGDRC